MAAKPPRYEQFDHTSEAGIIARGDTLAEAFANVAEGMYALVLEIEDVQPREQRDIAVEAGGHEALLIDWLMEIVFLTETEGLVFRRFEDGVVYLHMQGACSGCPSSMATLKMGIENLFKHFIPEVREVRPIE